jgi:hypothetical protein
VGDEDEIQFHVLSILICRHDSVNPFQPNFSFSLTGSPPGAKACSIRVDFIGLTSDQMDSTGHPFPEDPRAK